MPKKRLISSSQDKLQSKDEFVRWWQEGRTYDWIVEKYRTKYGIDIVPSTIGNWRHRLEGEGYNVPRRQSRDTDLVPWHVEREHKNKHAVAMLRAEARRRDGMTLAPRTQKLLNNWLAFLQEENAVVHYDPDTEEGFHYVHRRPQDTDIVRRPSQVTRARGVRE